MFKFLFPTIILEEQLAGSVFTSVQNELDEVLPNLQFSLYSVDDTGGLMMSDEGVQTTNNIIERYNLTNLEVEIIRCANKYLKETNTIAKVDFKITTSMMTLLPPQAVSTSHMHLSSCLVVVYYYKTPDHGGNLRLFNPSSTLEFHKDEYVDIVPTEGKLIVFPGWLYHQVLKNNSNLVRRSIAITIQIYEDFINENIIT